MRGRRTRSRFSGPLGTVALGLAGVTAFGLAIVYDAAVVGWMVHRIWTIEREKSKERRHV